MPRKSKKPKVLKGRRGRGGGGGFPRKPQSAPSAVANVFINPGYGGAYAYGDIANVASGMKIPQSLLMQPQALPRFIGEEPDRQYYTDVRGSREQYVTEPNKPKPAPSPVPSTNSAKPNVSVDGSPLGRTSLVMGENYEQSTEAFGYTRQPKLPVEQITKITQFFKPEAEPQTFTPQFGLSPNNLIGEPTRFYQEEEPEIAEATTNRPSVGVSVDARSNERLVAQGVASAFTPIKPVEPEFTPRNLGGRPAKYDYSEVTEDDITRMEQATGDNTDRARDKLYKAIRENYYKNENAMAKFTVREYINSYLAKTEMSKIKKSKQSI